MKNQHISYAALGKLSLVYMLAASSFCLQLGALPDLSAKNMVVKSAVDSKKGETALMNLRKKGHIRAFLDTIAYAEGTHRGTYKNHTVKTTLEGYRLRFGLALFDDFGRHPGDKHCMVFAGKYLCSTAAGRYQFLAGTWEKIAKKIGAEDFGPVNQDLAAIELIRERGAVPLVLEGRFEEAIKKTCTIWASLPGSPYGQPMHEMAKLKDFYEQRVVAYSRASGLQRG